MSLSIPASGRFWCETLNQHAFSFKKKKTIWYIIFYHSRHASSTDYPLAVHV